MLYIGDEVWNSGTIPYGNCFLGISVHCSDGQYGVAIADTPGGLYYGFSTAVCEPFEIHFDDLILEGRLPCCGSQDTVSCVVAAAGNAEE